MERSGMPGLRIALRSIRITCYDRIDAETV
jgi:hypothetical protein